MLAHHQTNQRCTMSQAVPCWFVTSRGDWLRFFFVNWDMNTTNLACFGYGRIHSWLGLMSTSPGWWCWFFAVGVFAVMCFAFHHISPFHLQVAKTFLIAKGRCVGMGLDPEGGAMLHAKKRHGVLDFHPRPKKVPMIVKLCYVCNAWQCCADGMWQPVWKQ